MNDSTATLKLGTATQLAAAGDYKNALAFLASTQSEAKPPASVLDLKAKIFAQQGRYREAIALWQEALRELPHNDDIKLAIARASVMLNKPLARMTPQLKRLAVVACGLLLLFSLFSWAFRPNIDNEFARLNSGIEQLRSVEDTTPGASDAQLEQLATLPEISSQLDQLAAMLQPKQDIPEPRATSEFSAPDDFNVTIAGVTTNVDNDQLVLVFRDGLYSKGTRLTAMAKQQLTKIAALLKDREEALRITVTGYTDNVPMRDNRDFSDNTSLAFDRAQTAAALLQRESGLNSSSFMLAASEDMIFPYTDRKSTDRLKNRTATVAIAAKPLPNKQDAEASAALGADPISSTTGRAPAIAQHNVPNEDLVPVGD